MRLLVVFLVIKGSQKEYQQEDGGDPEWMKVALGINADHINRFGHFMIVHEMPRMEITQFQKHDCDRSLQEKGEPWYEKCVLRSARDLSTWTKFKVLVDHLRRRDTDYVLFLDADAIIVHPYHDTLAKMVDELNSKNADVMMANEDWKPRDKNWNMINTGVILAKRSDWAINFFQGMLHRRDRRLCKSNEQTCLNGVYRDNINGSQNHIYIGSGSVWNRHPNIGVSNHSAEITHCMGGAKAVLRATDVYKCGRCPCVQGKCSGGLSRRGACLDVDVCAARYNPKQEKYAFVLVAPLKSSHGMQFTEDYIQRFADVARRHDATPVLVLPASTATQTVLVSEIERRSFSANGFEIVQPEKELAPLRHKGAIQSFHLVAFGITQYHAALVVTGAVELNGNYTSILRCAQQWRFLSSASTTFPLNSRIYAMRPEKELFSAMQYFAVKAAYTDFQGWDHAGWTPGLSKPNIAMDGFLWTFMLANGNENETNVNSFARRTYGAPRKAAVQIDSGDWNAGIPGMPTTKPLRNPGCDGTHRVKRIVH